MATKKETTPRVVVEGAVYKKAQLQEMLQQYETASGGIIKALTQAHQAALGKKFDQANMVLKKLDGVIDEKALKQLMDLNDTMAGHVGMGGN
jgi:mevalonate kinase